MSTFPKRRDTKALAAALALVEKNTEIEVVFRTERYGTFAVAGPSCSSSAYPGPVIAGHPVAPTGKAGTDVLLIVPEPAEQTDLLEELTEPRHGDWVRAGFSTKAWGDFTVTGHVVELAGVGMMVGGWFIHDCPGSQLMSLHRAAEAEGQPAAPSPAVVADTGA